MRVAHAGMHITDADFNALDQDLVKSPNKLASHSSTMGAGQSPDGRSIAGGGVWPRLPG